MVLAILNDRKTVTRRVGYPNQECPYGKIGDRLWVREALRNWRIAGGVCVAQYVADRVLVPASLSTPAWTNSSTPKVRAALWQWQRQSLPSIHMPRWASRILLEITELRLEPLQSINDADIIAEGSVLEERHVDSFPLGGKKCPVSAFDKRAYPDLSSLWIAGWDGINAKRGHSWKSNPWVWVIKFRRLRESPPGIS